MRNIFRLKKTTMSKLPYHPYSHLNIRKFYDKTGVFCIELLSPIVEGVIWYDQNDCTYYYRTKNHLYNKQHITWFLEEFTYCSYSEIATILERPQVNFPVYYKGDTSYV